METETKTPRSETRPVRVTIEGNLRQCTMRRSVLTFTGGSLILKADAPDVTVEELPSGRTWTDGDAVARGARVWSRRDGRWYLPGAYGVAEACDADVDAMLSEGAELLRCQAGA